MNSRDRVLAALRGEVPDRVPCALGFYHVDLQQRIPPADYPAYAPLIDVQFVSFPLSPEEKRLEQLAGPYNPDTRLGTAAQVATYARWDYHPETPDYASPLAGAHSLDDLRRFPFPEATGPYHAAGLGAQVEALHAQGQAAGGNLPHLGGELFEAAWRLRGLESFLLDLLRRPEWADFLLDRLAGLARRNAEALAQAGIDLLALDDDVGMPGTMLISPATWRRFFKPRLAAIIDAVHTLRPGLPILYHSDGSISPIVDDLIEIGVNALNPVQPEHMDAHALRRRYGPRLALWGTVGWQTTFSFGSAADIRREVEHRIKTLGRAGLILSPAYDVDEPDIPWTNVAAFLEAVRDCA